MNLVDGYVTVILRILRTNFIYVHQCVHHSFAVRTLLFLFFFYLIFFNDMFTVIPGTNPELNISQCW